jgi:hypothetical protein
MKDMNVLAYCLRYQILNHVLIRCVGVGKEKVVVIQQTKNSYSPSLVSLNIYREGLKSTRGSQSLLAVCVYYWIVYLSK